MFNHEELKVYFRDRIVDFREATISVANTGFMYGLGVFTGMRAHLNKETKALYLFRPEDHFKRFSFACRVCQYKDFLENYNYEKFLSVLLELLRVNKIAEDAYIRVTNFTDQNTVTPKFHYYRDSLTAFLYPIGDYVPTTGMKCTVSSWTRIEDNAIPARAKIQGAYVNTAFAKTEALQRGYEEAIVLDRYGHVVEGSAENIFLVMDGKLITPPLSDNILEGITRATVIELAKDCGYEVVERSVDRTELYKAEEIFLTGTGAQVSPVILIDHYSIGDGTVGPVSKRIQELYFRVVRGMEPKYERWLVKV